jgi:hypothetical protein
MLAALWNAVSQQSISNCFQKAGFFETQENLNKHDREKVHAPGQMSKAKPK